MGRAGDRAGSDLSAGEPRASGAEARARATREARTFDRLVGEAGDFNPFADHGWDVLASRFAAVVGQADRHSILDVGCGTGQSRRVYRARAARYTGVDLALGALALARRRAPDADWLRADALALPWADGSFDVVALSSVLHHLHDPVRALAEARRVLRPGGWVFAFDPNLRHPAMLLFRHPASPFYSPQGVSPDERPLTPPALRRMFRAAQLAEIGQRCQSDLPYRRVAPPRLDALLAVYNRLDRLWERVGLGRHFGTFVVTWARREERPAAERA